MQGVSVICLSLRQRAPLIWHRRIENVTLSRLCTSPRTPAEFAALLKGRDAREGGVARVRGARLAMRGEPARAVTAYLVNAHRGERDDHALRPRTAHDQEDALRPVPEALQVAGAQEEPVRLGHRGGNREIVQGAVDHNELAHRVEGQGRAVMTLALATQEVAVASAR